MKTLTTTLLLLCFAWTCVAQDKRAERIETIRQFLSDLKNDKPADDIFKIYLESGGSFDSQKTKGTANEWTHLVRQSIKTSDVAKVEIYKYTDRPETGRVLKKADDPGSSQPELALLEFELHGPDTKISCVAVDDLYVIKLHDQRIFVLFNSGLKMITWFALTWGNKVELVRF